MLHLLYMLFFVVLAVLAVGNLFRSMFVLGKEMQQGNTLTQNASRPTLHPELLDDSGKLMNEPLLVMRSLPIDDVRSKLDALYNASPGGNAVDSSDEHG